MAEADGGGPKARWWQRSPVHPRRIGGGLGRQLRMRLRPGRGVGEEVYEEIFELLLASDCGVTIAEALVSTLRERAASERLRDSEQLVAQLKLEMETQLAGRDRQLSVTGSPAVWLLAGVNGSGKTTTVAKLAVRLQAQGLTPLIAAADTFRAAAIDQLRKVAEPTGVEVVAHRPGADPAAVVFDALAAARARGRDVVLVDTAGRLHTNENLMQELGKIRRVVAGQQPDQPAEALLVVDAFVGANAIAQARSFGETIGATGLVLTKLDGSARGGFVFQVEAELSVPVKLVGMGESLSDMEDFDPAAYVEALLADDDSEPVGGG